MGAQNGDQYVLTFEQASNRDVALIGGKCAGLASLVAAGATVPPGFAVTTRAYLETLAARNLEREIRTRIEAIPADDVGAQARIAGEIQDLIKSETMPDRVTDAIRFGYDQLCTRAGHDLPVAVRSSGTSEDMPEASFAGQGDTFLWTVGANAVVDRVRDCWASLFTARAIAYRGKHKLAHLEQAMAVGVQQMADARAAGVAMSLDPSNGDRSKIVIESVWGLGEPLVSGLATPDYFVVDKVLLEPIKRVIASKPTELVADIANQTTATRGVEEARQNVASLTDAQIRAVARVVKAVERAFGGPQDVEWAIDARRSEDEGVVLLQCRPETVWSRKASAPVASKSYALGIEGVLSTLMAPIASRKH
ncbi:phosphoenolpyruvate synthase [Bradyrhizobium guangdongense]|uniref:PEP/pyruvate-binding domain-containing protein n=1 Tax=Bradyrhizobium guangdongense TaxID=1325090 RepID=UPI001125EEE5|nr:PEP/pyruvate-binding domain-containing protein [Bradyrhizobium guangdongense]TPQ25664.1 phosphoenolpyruvate synthase [Bradyrhizobium guangdongense]